MGQDDGDLPSHGQPEAQAAMSIREPPESAARPTGWRCGIATRSCG